MRHIISRTALIVAALMIMAVPVLADEAMVPGEFPAAGQAEKNECLLVAKNCEGQVDSYQERIDKIQNEINRGTDVYTDDEIKRLRDKLDDANRNLDGLMIGA